MDGLRMGFDQRVNTIRKVVRNVKTNFVDENAYVDDDDYEFEFVG
jgi:hypothetical protein